MGDREARACPPLDFTGPKARTRGLESTELDGEVVIYDGERRRLHCLDRAAAVIWRHCDGRTGAAELRRILDQELGTAEQDELVVWYTLKRLRGAALLEGELMLPDQARTSTRRELLRRAVAAGALLILPSIVSIPAPTALQAQASPCVPSGQACTTDLDCCSFFCNPGGRCR